MEKMLVKFLCGERRNLTDSISELTVMSCNPVENNMQKRLTWWADLYMYIFFILKTPKCHNGKHEVYENR